MSSKYQHLISVLDTIAEQAPESYQFYRSNDDEHKQNQIRARAYIHLLLLAKFGVTDFNEREKLVTDGTNDGGIDGYFIDYEYKVIYFIQSKFRISSKNFEEKEIRFEELLAMEVDRILKGEVIGENSVGYNGKILNLIKKIRSVSDIARYQYKIIVLANIKSISREKLFRLSGGFPTEVISHQNCYEEILFPVLAGTYFNSAHLFINLNLSNKQSGTKISYSVETAAGGVDITVVFVPAIEIAKTLSRYRNSILKYNPRCYLEFSESKINSEIIDSVVNNNTNEFALFNNGITMLSEETSINERIGLKDRAQLLIKNPQIINGGQTAFSLSRVFEQSLGDSESIFQGKEVLLKIITISNENIGKEESLSLIESISNATNKQNVVTYADRHSNDRVQLRIQKLLYQKYGVLYERKRGEFADAIKFRYISPNNITSRTEILRISRALDGSLGKKQSGKKYFNDEQYYKRYFNEDDVPKYYFGLVCLKAMESYRGGKKLRSESIERGLRFGPYFVIFMLSRILPDILNMSKEEISTAIDVVLSEWINFEENVIKLQKNECFFRTAFDKVSREAKQIFEYRKYFQSDEFIKDAEDFFGVLLKSQKSNS